VAINGRLSLVLERRLLRLEFRSHHFCCGKPDTARPIRLVLIFIERTAGEWLTGAYQAIHKLLLPTQCRPQELPAACERYHRQHGSCIACLLVAHGVQKKRRLRTFVWSRLFGKHAGARLSVKP
jgi:hypothetical protein